MPLPKGKNTRSRGLNAHPEGRTLWTTLTPEENRDAVAAMNSLKSRGSSYSLSFAVDYFLQNYRPPDQEKAIDKAADEYIQHRERDCVREFISRAQFRSIKSEMLWFKGVFGRTSVSAITVEKFRDYLETPRNRPRSRLVKKEVTAPKTWNNRRGLLSTFCLFCVERGYLAENTIAKVPQCKINGRKSMAQTLSFARVQELMEYLEAYDGSPTRRLSDPQPAGFLVPFFALALFAGIRPDALYGEMGKLQPGDIDLNMGVVRVRPEVSKTTEMRVVAIQPNLLLWLEKYPLDRFPLLPGKNIVRILSEVRQKFSIGHDVLRHTYISMLVGAFRSVGDASLQAGNSEAIICRHYLDSKSTAELTPSGASPRPEPICPIRWKRRTGDIFFQR
jgi:hypothetical protein